MMVNTIGAADDRHRSSRRLLPFRELRLQETRTLLLRNQLTAAILTGLILGVAPAHADDSDYWLVRVADDHTVFDFIDASTLTRDGPIRSVWLTEIAAGPKVVKNSIRRKMTMTWFDCAHSLYRDYRTVTFDRKASVLSDHLRDSSTYQAIVPGSMVAIEIEFACANSDHWTARKGWTEIDVSPEKMSDDDNKAFQPRHAP